MGPVPTPDQAIRPATQSVTIRPITLCVAVLLAALLGAAPVAFAQHEGESPSAPVTDEPAPGEKALFSRLVAPCCWNQTLDIHGGAAPEQLRAEIRKRLQAGETPDTIERDFVARYGQRVLAVPPGSPIGTIALLLGMLALAAGGGVFVIMRRWRNAGDASGEQPAKKPEPAGTRDAYDDKLDEELRALD